MSRKRNRGGSQGRKKCGFFDDGYWQTPDWNQRVYRKWQNYLYGLATNRYIWTGLDSSIDQRFLETTLLFDGFATIAHPKANPFLWVGTKAVLNGQPNVYQNPTKWESFGVNNWRFDVTTENGVLVWDNRLRVSILDELDQYARILASYERTEQINLAQQKIPYILVAPQEKLGDLQNLAGQIMGGEPCVLGFDGLQDIRSYNLFDTKAPLMVKELHDGKREIISEALNFLGIENTGVNKQAGVGSSEVESANAPSNMRALDGLNARREAADFLNKRFGKDIHVYWNQDIQTDNWAYMNTASNFIGEGEKDNGTA